MKYDKIPSSKLLPHMIRDDEVPQLIKADDRAEESVRRRLDRKNDREEANRMTKMILGSAAVFAAVAMLGKEAVDYNRSHPVKPNHPQLTQPSAKH